MPKFVIEREIPCAGNMSAEELRGAAQQSNAVLGSGRGYLLLREKRKALDG